MPKPLRRAVLIAHSRAILTDSEYQLKDWFALGGGFREADPQRISRSPRMNDSNRPSRVRHQVVLVTTLSAILLYLDRVCIAEIAVRIRSLPAGTAGAMDMTVKTPLSRRAFQNG